jgi:antitoxin MazE
MDIHDASSKTVSLRVAKWGNSLAVRLPVDYVRQAGLIDGDTLVLSQAPDGTLSLKPGTSFDHTAFVARLRKQTAKMKMGSSVVEQMRKEARY